MQKLTKAGVCRAFSREAEPALHVRAGEVFCLETEDAYSGTISGPEDAVPRAIRANPATGPVFIQDAQRGDILRVEIERIQLRDYAVMSLPAARVYPMRRDGLQMPDRVRLALKPMIGLVGVAPRIGPIPTTDAGEHGGSLDCPQFGTGCSIFLPISCEGALLAIGGVHAAMADGKAAGAGAEVAAEVTLRARPVIHPLPTPCVETGNAIVFLGAASTLDDCMDLVVEKAHSFLTEWLHMDEGDALALLGLAGDVGVCRGVGAQKTMQLSLPKHVLTPLGLAEVPALQRRPSELAW